MGEPGPRRGGPRARERSRCSVALARGSSEISDTEWRALAPDADDVLGPMRSASRQHGPRCAVRCRACSARGSRCDRRCNRPRPERGRGDRDAIEEDTNATDDLVRLALERRGDARPGGDARRLRRRRHGGKRHGGEPASGVVPRAPRVRRARAPRSGASTGCACRRPDPLSRRVAARAQRGRTGERAALALRALRDRADRGR